MKNLYHVKKIEELAHTGTVRTIFQKLNNGIKEGVEMEINADTFYAQNPAFVQRLKTNTWYFSAAKNHADLVAMNNILIDEQGKLRTWNQFKKEAEKVVGRSARYLKTEYVTAVASSRMAARWQKLQEQKHIYPNAKFYVVMDKNTTEICNPLHNVVVPLDHPLLKTHFPPNHFNCRTDVLGTSEKPTPNSKITIPDIPENFRNNIGITGKIFSENSSYLDKLKNSYTKKDIDDFVYQVMSEDESFLHRYKSDKTGSTVRVNLNADLRDYTDNLHLAKLIADYEPVKIDLLPHYEGQKNPELRIWDIIGDATNRTGNTKNFVKNSFKKLYADGQLYGLEETFLALNFRDIPALSNKEFKAITGALKDKFEEYTSVKFVYIIYNNKVIKVYNKPNFAYIRATLSEMKHKGK